MTIGDKLTKLRRDNNYTQEQLADMLGVSRQSVSKWESDVTYPETEKLLRLGEIYGCSMDYLLKDTQETQAPKSTTVTLDLRALSYERKSERSIFGLPLWHINIGFGRKAKGVIAIGFFAKGIISIGAFSLGVISLGLCSLGAFALGLLSLGLISIGTMAAGIISCGAICLGIVSVGAISIGNFSVGALSIGKYFAWGDHADAMIAIGKSKVTGDVFQKLGELTAQEAVTVKELLDVHVPYYLSWAKDMVKMFI